MNTSRAKQASMAAQSRWSKARKKRQRTSLMAMWSSGYKACMTLVLFGETGAAGTGIIDTASACHCHEKPLGRIAWEPATGHGVTNSRWNEGVRVAS